MVSRSSARLGRRAARGRARRPAARARRRARRSPAPARRGGTTATRRRSRADAAIALPSSASRSSWPRCSLRVSDQTSGTWISTISAIAPRIGGASAREQAPRARRDRAEALVDLEQQRRSRRRADPRVGLDQLALAAVERVLGPVEVAHLDLGAAVAQQRALAVVERVVAADLGRVVRVEDAPVRRPDLDAHDRAARARARRRRRRRRRSRPACPSAGRRRASTRRAGRPPAPSSASRASPRRSRRSGARSSRRRRPRRSRRRCRARSAAAPSARSAARHERGFHGPPSSPLAAPRRRARRDQCRIAAPTRERRGCWLVHTERSTHVQHSASSPSPPRSPPAPRPSSSLPLASAKGGDRQSRYAAPAPRARPRSSSSKPRGRGIEVEFEVDQNRNGVPWKVTLRRNGSLVAVDDRTTRRRAARSRCTA